MLMKNDDLVKISHFDKTEYFSKKCSLFVEKNVDFIHFVNFDKLHILITSLYLFKTTYLGRLDILIIEI